MRISQMTYDQLEQARDAAEAAGKWARFEACEAELERRDYDDSDPAAPAAVMEDARDSALDLAALGIYLDEAGELAHACDLTDPGHSCSYRGELAMVG